MSEIQIRRYNDQDKGAVRALSQRLSAGFAPWRDQAKVAEAVSTWLEGVLSESQDEEKIVFVAHAVAAGVVGFIAVVVEDHYISGRDAHVGELAVAEAWEGQRVGRQLVSAATDWARDQQCQQLTLRTGAGNLAARMFYEHLGFQQEDVGLALSIVALGTGG